MLTLADIFEGLTTVRPDFRSQVVTEAVVDSRQAVPGSLFVALPGERTDGHNFIGDAFHHGAVAALVQQDQSGLYPQLDLRSGNLPDPVVIPDVPFCIWVEDSLASLQKLAKFWRSRSAVRVIAITGSVGKSTTKEVVADVLSLRYKTLRSAGNLNNEIGLPLTLLRLDETCQRAVLEMGFYVPGEINLLCDIAQPSIGVITNVGMVHASRAGSQEAIARGKAELVESLPAAPAGVAVLNYDDPLVRQMASRTHARVFFYGLDQQADLWADMLESHGLEGISFRLHYRGEMLYLRAPLIGRHSVHTALRAAAVGLADSLTWQEIAAGLRMSHTQLRLVTVQTKSGALLLDDTYNASPESTLAALNLLDELDGRKVAILGDMLELGIYERIGHEMIGIRAAEVAAELVLVGERSLFTAEAAGRSGLDKKHIHWFPEPIEAAAYLQTILGPSDVALVKGSRSMQMDKIVSALETVS